MVISRALGDAHPQVGLALGLQKTGHEVLLHEQMSFYLVRISNQGKNLLAYKVIAGLERFYVFRRVHCGLCEKLYIHFTLIQFFIPGCFST
jgi:hypothetical protein